MKSPEYVEYQYVNVELESLDESRLTIWLKKVIAVEKGDILSALTFIFCDDDYLLSLNKEYLDHDEYTDVITFDYSDEIDGISGDIFVSVTRVADNAATFGVDTRLELYRVMLHGVLHLLGYADKEPHERLVMREKENYYLSLLS